MLEKITIALVNQLREHYHELQVNRNGALQITLFRQDFHYAQIVVSHGGIYLVVDPTRDLPESENVKGPFALEDPRMYDNLRVAISKWLVRN